MRNHKHKEQSGEITASGTDNISITLGPRPPHAVEVRFEHHPHHVPCNPAQDKLEHEIIRVNNEFILKISWSVSDVREIVWHVRY